MPEEGGKDITTTEKPVRINIGNVCIEISCNDRNFLDKARIDYHPFLVSRKPDFKIKFDLRDKLKAYEVKTILLNFHHLYRIYLYLFALEQRQVQWQKPKQRQLSYHV